MRTSLRELRGDVRVKGFGLFTRRQVELLMVLKKPGIPPGGTKSATVLSLQARGLLRMRIPVGAFMWYYNDLECTLTQAGVQALKAIRKV